MSELNEKLIHKYKSELKEKEKAILEPLDSVLNESDFSPGGRHYLILGKTLNERERKEYINDLVSDLEEIDQEIVNAKSLEDVLPLLGAKYTIERTLISEERSILAEKRTFLSEGRTEAAEKRTEFSEKRTGLAGVRTELAKRRSFMSEKRTVIAQQRTLLARARTELAFIRTGMAFIALATGFIRYFGIGWWTFLDAGLLASGVVMVITGISYYIPTRKREGGLLDIIREKENAFMNKKPRMLIIDDDPAICDLLKVFFNNENYDVRVYTDPFVAKNRIESIQFDVAITGLMMDNRGEKIVRTIRRLSPDTPIIMISFMSPVEESIEDIKDELFDFFQKPLNLDDLKRSVEKAVSKDLLT